MSEYYYYGIAAMLYVSTCWSFAFVRWFHTCQAPKDQRRYIWPDRKLQVLAYSMATLLLPYIVNPTSPSAWILVKNYFPATYYFYCGMLLLCYFGTVKQWNRWKPVTWIAAISVFASMLIPVLNAWLPAPILTDDGLRVWQRVMQIEMLLMILYLTLAMWQVKRWLDQARDANYSNPDDFPTDYAHRVLHFPVVITPLIWPAYLFDSPSLMAIQLFLLAAFNVVMLLTAMPVWRRNSILVAPDSDIALQPQSGLDESIAQTAMEIEDYVKGEQAFLNNHLKIDDVVDHCQHGRTYVSLAFQRRFGSFSSYVNGLRLEHYEQYAAEHPNETKESAALSSGFPSYNAYYRAKQRLAK